MLSDLVTKYLPPFVISDAEFDGNWSGSRERRSFSRWISAPCVPAITHAPSMKAEEILFEKIDLLEAIDASKDTFTMAELGAGYGRWLVAGAIIARRAGRRLRLIGVEAEPTHFAMIRQHMLDNDIDPAAHRLIEGAINERDGPVYFVQGHPEEWFGQSILPAHDYGFGDWPRATVGTTPGYSLSWVLRDVDDVDLIDMDIQGSEGAVVRGGKDVLANKVRRVHIGTHSAEVEAELRETFHAMGWDCRNDYPCRSTVMTPYGEIEFEDGVQTWINPRL